MEWPKNLLMTTGELYLPANIGFNPLRPTIWCAVIIKDSFIIDFCVGNRVYTVVTGMYSGTVYRVYSGTVYRVVP